MSGHCLMRLPHRLPSAFLRRHPLGRVALVLALGSASCAAGDDPGEASSGPFTNLSAYHGGITYCFMTEHDVDEDTPTVASRQQRDEQRVLQTLVTDLTEPPQSWSACADEHPARAEFIDDHGDRLWLSLYAELDEEPLFGADLLASFVGATLELRTTGEIFPSRSLALRRDSVPVFLMQAGDVAERLDAAPFTVSSYATALPTPTFCEAPTDLALTVAHEGDSVALANGEAGSLAIDAQTFTVINLSSRGYYPWRDCDSLLEGDRLTWFLRADEADD